MFFFFFFSSFERTFKALCNQDCSVCLVKMRTLIRKCIVNSIIFQLCNVYSRPNDVLFFLFHLREYLVSSATTIVTLLGKCNHIPTHKCIVK